MDPRSLSRFVSRVKNPLWSAAALVIVVEGMKAAADILIPITVAVMLAIVVSPAVGWLEKRRVPNVLAVLAAVGAIMAVLAAIGALIGASLSGFRDSIPHYKERLAAMVYAGFEWLSARGIVLKADELIGMIEPGKAAEKAAGFITSSLSGLGAALSNTVLVMLTMILILMEGKSVPRKLRALAGDPDADIGQFRSIAQKVQSYLAIKTVISLSVGVVVALWSWILDVDFAALWGLLAFLLNYIPNVGAILSAIPAVLLALVQHGVGTSLALGAGYAVAYMVIGNVIEPMWMGRRLGLSTAVVFVSLVVWYWVWGPVGMLLSVPLTMVLKIMLEQSGEWSAIATVLDTAADDAPSDAPAASTEPPDTPEPPAPEHKPTEPET